MLSYQILACTIHEKESHTKTINLRQKLENGTKNWSTLWIVFCIKLSRLFWIFLKRHGEKIDNTSIRTN